MLNKEKQASSEIAQSRERFDARKFAEKAFKEVMSDIDPNIEICPPIDEPVLAELQELFEQAERDTRERVAKEIEEKAALKGMYLKWLVKAIRGKE